MDDRMTDFGAAGAFEEDRKTGEWVFGCSWNIPIVDEVLCEAHELGFDLYTWHLLVPVNHDVGTKQAVVLRHHLPQSFQLQACHWYFGRLYD